MRITFTLFILYFFLIIGTISVKAQDINITESRCVNTGMIVFGGVVGAGAPYQLSVTSYPSSYSPPGIHFTNNLPDTFAALFPGTYSFKIVDGTGGIFLYPDIVVPGNYVLPGNNDYTPTTTPATVNCGTPNGRIQGMMRNGRPPYAYTIIEGLSQVGVTSTTGTFVGLSQGLYRVQAEDSCQNIQTRYVTVGSNFINFSVNSVSVSRINCSLFSLNSISASASIASYEIINYTGSGDSVIRVSGNTFPAAFTLFAAHDIQNGMVKIKVNDDCGRTVYYTPSRFDNVTGTVFSGGVINKISCDSFSLDALTISPALQAGSFYEIRNLNTGVVYTSASLPLHFAGLPGDIKSGKIAIKIVDSCGNFDSTNQFRTIANDWNFTPLITTYCNTITINGINFTGQPASPYVVKIKAYFKDDADILDSTSEQVAPDFPYTITGIMGNPNTVTIAISIIDNCGEKRFFSVEQFFRIFYTLQPVSCSNTTVRLSAGGVFVQPVTYSVIPDMGTTPNTTGIFTLPQGTFVFQGVDSCGKIFRLNAVKIERGFQLKDVLQQKQCTPEFITNTIDVPARSFGKLTILQYEGGMPVNASSVLVSTRIFRSQYNNCVSCEDNTSTNERIIYDSTLPGRIYTYIVTDSCGSTDTISVANQVLPSPAFYHAAYAKTKCINGSDIYAKWRSNGEPSNTVIVSVFDAGHNLLLGFNSGGISNMDRFPNGQPLLFDLQGGIYTIEYTFSNCTTKYIDTVIVRDYRQPQINTVESFTPCSNGGSPVIITSAEGISPYTYAIVNSTPDHFTSPTQMSPVFTLPVSQSTVTVRLVDFCLNSATRTIAVTRAAPTIIRSSSPLLTTCSLPFNFTLFTDSLYDGSVFEWIKLTGNGAGTSVLSNRPFLNVTYNSPSDSGIYQVRVRVPNSCYNSTAEYNVHNVVVTCIPGIAGNVFNDANGLQDGVVNGQGTNAGGLYAILVNAAGNTVAVSPVNVDGTYGFTQLSSGNYAVIISTSTPVINSPAPATVLPEGWVSTGEHIGAFPGSDGVSNGRISNITVDTLTITELNFGIERLPVANDTIVSRINLGGSLQVDVPVLTGSDAEDGIYDGISGINTIIIQSLPINAILYYNNIPLSAGQMISNYNPALLTIDPFNGIASAQFTFSEVDAATNVSLPDTVIILFTSVPVTIVDFTAIRDGKNVKLNWNVAEQINILNYTIEHSLNGYNFTPLGVVVSADITFYNMMHVNPFNGINYYRLKITGTDGKIAYSKIVTVYFNVPLIASVKPNPFKEKLDVAATLQKNSLVKVAIHDIEGTIVYKNIFSGYIGNNVFLINRLHKLSAGIYILSLIADDFLVRIRILKD